MCHLSSFITEDYNCKLVLLTPTFKHCWGPLETTKQSHIHEMYIVTRCAEEMFQVSKKSIKWSTCPGKGL